MVAAGVLGLLRHACGVLVAVPPAGEWDPRDPRVRFPVFPFARYNSLFLLLGVARPADGMVLHAVALHGLVLCYACVPHVPLWPARPW